MQGSEINNPDIKALRRIVALLLALASLADRASGRSLAVRWAVLWLLRPGEAIARDYIAALTGDPRLAIQPSPTAVLTDGCGTSDAMRLALTFRTLAALLAAFSDTLSAALQAGVALVRWADLTRHPAGPLTALPGRMPAVDRCDSS